MVKKKTFESGLKELESIVEKLESEELTLDESIALFRQGTELAEFCAAKLRDAEQSVKQLTKSMEDKLGVKDFEITDK
jgi:exodeoxyribonuclease VII small subunit